MKNVDNLKKIKKITTSKTSKLTGSQTINWAGVFFSWGQAQGVLHIFLNWFVKKCVV